MQYVWTEEKGGEEEEKGGIQLAPAEYPAAPIQ